MSILVTGATGTVGRHVLRQVSKRGVKVRALSGIPRKPHSPPVSLSRGKVFTSHPTSETASMVASLFRTSTDDR